MPYCFFFFFLDFLFSLWGDGEELSELFKKEIKRKIRWPSINPYHFCFYQAHALTCLCSCFSFSSSDCASWEENLSHLNLPPTWQKKKVNPALFRQGYYVIWQMTKSQTVVLMSQMWKLFNSNMHLKHIDKFWLIQGQKIVKSLPPRQDYSIQSFVDDFQ